MLDHINRAIELKQKLVDFVYDAEGELAVALESFAAQKSQKNASGINQQNITVDLFLTQGEVSGQTPLTIFLAQNQDLKTSEIETIKLWHHNLIGLFEIKAIHPEYYEFMNWLTAKSYRVYSHSQIPEKETKRWQPGEIILTIIAPIDNSNWFLFSDRMIKGRLSQPKLAVAIGEFRDNYPESLYADAPELLAQAWDSVKVYHQEFVAYFGSDRLTLPGYKLNQKIGDLQQIMSQKKLAEAGIDDSKSLSEMLKDSGTTEEEFAETAKDLGADAQAVSKMMQNQEKLSMVTPKVELPPEIKQAESVTVFSEPQWGQMFLPDLEKFTNLLANPELDRSDIIIRQYLEKPEANYYVWQQLKQEYPEGMKTLLQQYTEQTDFDLDTDLTRLLLQHDKSDTPELPAIASVPIHLNNLFEAAVAQVQKTKAKPKKTKKKKGFM